MDEINVKLDLPAMYCSVEALQCCRDLDKTMPEKAHEQILKYMDGLVRC